MVSRAELNKAFSRVLRDLREDHNLNQGEVAEQSNLQRTYISQLERKQKHASIETLFKICSAFEIKPSDFLKLMEKELELFD